MKLKMNREPVRTCGNCELWSPDKHIMTSVTGLCEKYATMVDRHLGVCVWRDGVDGVQLSYEIASCYERFKARYQRPEITGRHNAVQKHRPVQTDFQDDLEA